jgi:hypothetical protein
MNKSIGFIYIPAGKSLPQPSINTRWDVNDQGVCQQALIDDINIYNAFRTPKSVYVSFHSINNQHGAFLRIFTGVDLESSEIQKTSFLEVNLRLKNLFLATLIERKKFVLQFIYTVSGRTHEYSYPLDNPQISKLVRCLNEEIRTKPKKQNFDLAKDELEKRFPISREIQTFRKLYVLEKLSRPSVNLN